MQRNIAQLTSPEVAALELSTDGALILPIGAIEQHGPHLSTDCDLVFAEQFLEQALAQLADDTKVWRLPMLPISKSNEHAGFPGTWYLSAQTFSAVITDIAHSAKANGFRRLILWNCHGGNRAILEVLARDIRLQTELMMFQIFAPATMPDPLPPIDPREPLLGIHAGEWETSVMLALSPDRVRMDQADCSFPKFHSENIALEMAGVTLGWKTSDFQPTGTWGDATAASAERGRLRLNPLINHLARVLTEIAAFEY